MKVRGIQRLDEREKLKQKKKNLINRKKEQADVAIKIENECIER